jgi:hypothetical protein
VMRKSRIILPSGRRYPHANYRPARIRMPLSPGTSAFSITETA